MNALTGASGAGAALACRLSRPGHRLIVAARLPVPARSAAAGEEQVEQAEGG
ncbi:UDP-glucose 4-epimerase WbpV [Actinomadura verrucosospora]|uniref:UDP-glucose 4-epimerase WbpV n=1 Tax=Actinomadura verrucosospora TaxID=46165 RepID=A0A7D3VT09_ACTVE|nr:UDP-glucose 4-epimerase WbpV [Actinomadura verrucosospora]